MASASYASAEYSYNIGNYDTAKKQLENAKKYRRSAVLDLKIDDLAHRLKTIDK